MGNLVCENCRYFIGGNYGKGDPKQSCGCIGCDAILIVTKRTVRELKSQGYSEIRCVIHG